MTKTAKYKAFLEAITNATAQGFTITIDPTFEGQITLSIYDEAQTISTHGHPGVPGGSLDLIAEQGARLIELFLEERENEIQHHQGA
jgi:hypothetical protein